MKWKVPCVEVNALMKTFKMKPLLFPPFYLLSPLTAAGWFSNCCIQLSRSLDAPTFMGSGMVLRKISNSVSDFPVSSASEALMKNKEAGAVADLYGIRASLVDGGEIRGAGNAWICPEVVNCLLNAKDSCYFILLDSCFLKFYPLVT
ncbi:hypothetical protein AAG906_031130 [Vitis piasezkii]